MTAFFILTLAIIVLVYGWGMYKHRKKILLFPMQISYWISSRLEGRDKADQRAAYWMTDGKLIVFGMTYILIGLILLVFGVLLLIETFGKINISPIS